MAVLALAMATVATTAVASTPLAGPHGRREAPGPAGLPLDRSQARVAEAVAQAAAAARPDVALPPGALDGGFNLSTDRTVLRDQDGDGVVKPAPEPAPELSVAPAEPAVAPDALPEASARPAGELVERARQLDLSAARPGDEVVALRTKESRTFAEAGGRLRTEVSTAPLFVPDAAGQLVRPDTTPRTGPDGRWQPAAGRAGVSFGVRATDGWLASIGFPGGRELSWSLRGAAPVVGTPVADRLVFGQVLEGVDLEVYGTANGVKDVIVLRDASAPSIYEFELDHPGLRIVVDDPYASIRLVDAQNGEPLGVIPSAWARDGNRGPGGELLDPQPAAYELVERDGRSVLRVKLDERWLRDPARRFPVRLDPSVVDAGAEGDSWVHNGFPSSNFSTDTILKTGGGGGNRRTYYAKWNVGLLAAATILDATYATLNVYSYSCQPRWFGVYRITTGWDPATVNYSNQPNYDHTVLGAHNIAHGYEPGGCGDAWVYSPIRDLVQRWVDATWPNHGLTGRVAEWDNYDDDFSYKHFASREAGGNGGQIITIVWTPYRVDYAFGGSDNTLSNNSTGHMDVRVTNKAWLNWNASGANPFRLGYHVYRSDGTTLVDWEGRRTSLPHDLTIGQSVWLEAAVDPLPPGSYQIKWDMVRDGVTWFSQQGNHPDLLPMAVAVTVPNHKAYIEEASPGGTVETLAPTLRVVGRNPDGWPSGGLQYAFKLCEDSAMTLACQSSPWQTTTTWAPADLRWAKTYYWNAAVRETGTGAATTTASWKVALTPTVVQPPLERHFGSDPYAPLHGGVNPSVGNYVASYTDAQIAGAGLPIELTRTYNSMDTRVGGFGPGWSTFLDLSATAESAARVLVSFPDGRRERFARNNDGSWASAPGILSNLTDRAGGGWELIRPDQMVYAFDAQGRPVQIRDTWGNTLTLRRDEAGLVDRLTNDTAGRSLHLTWSALGPAGAQVITAARTDPVTVEGQVRTPEWTYGYDPAGRLASTCVPQAAPACTTYHYHTSGTGASGKLQRVVKPGGNDGVELHYGTDGTVDWLENGTNHRWTFADADDRAEGTYHPISGWRAATATVGANTTIDVDVTGGGGVPPAGVQAVVVDVSADRPGAGGWFALFPSGTTEPPSVSTMDYGADDLRSTLHTVAVGTNGKITLSNHGAGSVNVAFDVVGWYGAAGTPGGSVFVPVATKRILDTRIAAQGPALGAGATRAVQVTGVAGLPADGVTAVVFDLETVNGSATTTLTSYASGATRPAITTLSTLAGKITDNLQIAPVGADGKVVVYNATGTIHILVDIVGYFADPSLHGGNVFRPITNKRLLDTRGDNQQWETPWPAAGKRPIVMAGEAGIPERGVSAVVGDVQMLRPVADNPMYMSASGSTVDGTTYVAQKGSNVGNHFYTGLADNGAADLYSLSRSADVVVDVVGYFTPLPRTVHATDPRGNSVEYRFDELGRLTGRTDQDGNGFVYAYNDEGHLWLNADATGAWRTFTYDVEGRLLTERVAQFVADPNLRELWGSSKHFGYVDDPANPARDGKLAWVSDGRAANRDDTAFRTSYTYNALGQLLTVRGPALPGAAGGVGVTRTYTPGGLLATETDAAGLVTTYRYDSRGDLAEVVHPSTVANSRRDVFGYDELGRCVSETEYSNAFPAGATTTRVYDDLARVVKETGPPFTNPVTGSHRRVASTTYTANGQPALVTVASTAGGAARWTDHSYDPADRLIGTVDVAGRTTSRTYDATGNLATSTGHDGVTVEYGYNRRNLVTTVTAKAVVDDPIGAPGVSRDVVLTAYGYDAAGRRTSEVDGAGRITRHAWRADGTVELTSLVNARDTDPDTGLPDTSVRTVLSTGTRRDAAGNPIEEFVPSDVSHTDDFPGTALAPGWTATGTWSVTGGDLRAAGTGVVSRAGAADGQVGVVVGAGGPALPAFRIVNSTNYHYVSWVAWPVPEGGLMLISRVRNGTGEVIAHTPWSQPAPGDRVETVFIGDRIWVLVNGAIRLDAVDATNENATGVGVAADAANERATSFRFDAYRRTVNTFDAYGRTTASVFDPGGADLRTATVRLPDGRPDQVTVSRATSPTLTRTTDYAYDSAGRLDFVEEVVEGGARNRTDVTFDDRGLLSTVVTPEGGRTDNAYDALGRVVTVTAPARTVERYGQPALPDSRPVSTFGYNVFDERDIERDASGRTTAFWYDQRGLPLAIVLPGYTPPGGTGLSRAAVMTYDGAGRMLTRRDLAGQTTDYTYNSLGLLVARTDPAVGGAARGQWRTRYDDAGRVVETVDPTGAVKRYRWSDVDRLTGVERVVRQPSLASHVAAASYGDGSGLLRTRSAAGVIATADYDLAGRQLRTLDAAGNTTTNGYDELSRRTLVTGPDGRAVRTTYNLAGDVTAEQFLGPDGALVTATGYTWDRDHRLREAHSPRGAAEGYGTTFTYDPAGQLTSRTTPIAAGRSGVESQGYDDLGRPTRYTDGRGNATWQTYNAIGLPEDLIAPAAGPHTSEVDRRWRTVYDAAGRPVTELAPGGVSVSTSYDELGRPHQRSGTGASASTQTRTFGWDAAGRLTNASTPSGAQTFGYDDRGLLLSADGASGNSSYAYDADGRVSVRTDASGTVQFAYDARGLPDTMTSSLSGQVSFDFDQAGRPLLVDYGATERRFTYDPRGRLDTDTLTTAAAVLYGLDYGYDLDGNVTSKAVSGAGVPGAGSNVYTYDRHSWLTSWIGPGRPAEAYAWDDAGNRTQAGTSTFAYDAQNRLISSTGPAGTATYTWNANGTLQRQSVPAGTWTFGFDAFEQLRQSTGPDGTRTHTYDGIGRRLTSPTGALSYASKAIRPAADGAYRYQPGPVGVVAVDDLAGGGGTWVHTDAHTDAVGSFAAGGASLATAEAFSPWGESLGTTGPASPLGYQSERRDLPSGFVPMGEREYDPATGTFVSRDPVMDSRVPGGYRYTPSNPLGHTDPTGTCVPACTAPAVAAGPPGWVVAGAGAAIGVGVIWSRGGFDMPCLWGCGGSSSREFGGLQSAASAYLARQAAMRSAYAHDSARADALHSIRGYWYRTGNGSTGGGGGGGDGPSGRGPGGRGPGGWGPPAPPPPPPPPPNWIVYGYPPAQLPPIAYSALATQVMAGLSAVPNYPGRIQRDPSTGRTVDTGASSISTPTAATVTITPVNIPVSPGVIQTAVSGSAATATAAAAVPAPMTPPDGGIDPETATDLGMCAHDVGQAAAGDGDWANAALSCVTAVPPLGPARGAAQHVDEVAPPRGRPGPSVSPTPSGSSSPDAGVEVLFGQRRISPEFSRAGVFRERSIYAVAADLKAGRLNAQGITVHAFWHNGQLVAENNRSLAALSLAGLRPVNIQVLDDVPADVLARLSEPPLVGGALPSPVTAVTPSQEDLRIGDIISIAGGG